jgi:AhpD family alkylhydroperoxidase
MTGAQVATGHASEKLFAAIKGAIGKVPNAYDAIGSNSALALEAALGLDNALQKSSLSKQEIEVIKIVTSEVVVCDYCLAAHVMVGKSVGLSGEAMLAMRRGEPSGNSKLDALAAFVRTLVATRGTVPAQVVEAVREAGYSDPQIVDTLLAISGITFTNLVNRVNDTEVDFPAVPAL